ncbi:MAG: poly(R)-hydroxyalkanoic acid synthase subunit PhaE [Gammaproteobacteria bacterium]
MSDTADNPWAHLWRAWMPFDGAAGDTATAGVGASDTLGAAVDGFRRFGEAVSAALTGVPPAGQANALADYIESLRETAGGSVDTAWFAVPFLWSAGILEGPVGRGWQGAFDTASGWARELLDVPSIGPQREWQEAFKAVARASLDEHRARQTLLSHQQRVQVLALQRFAAYLREESGAPVTSLRGLYDAWIANAEQAYREVVMEASYSRDFGAWVNATNAARLALAGLEERFGAALDRPRQSTLDALASRQATLQAEIARLREELTALASAQPRSAAVSKTTTAPPRHAASSAAQARAEPAAAAKSAPPERAAAARSTRRQPKAGRRPAAGTAKVTRAQSKKARGAKPGAAREFDIARIIDEAD